MADATVPPPVPDEFKKTREYYDAKGIELSEGSFKNLKGCRICTFCWKPKSQKPKGLVFMCHGYGVDCGTYFCYHAERIVSQGYTAYGVDYQGFGQSEGLRGMISSLDEIVEDLVSHWTPIREAPENAGLAKFLIGESLGGAVALKLHLREPDAWRGAVLLAPMCKIADHMKPSRLVQAILWKMVLIWPTWAIVPTRDIAEESDEDPKKSEKIKRNPLIYRGSPRLGTAAAMLTAAAELERKLEQVSGPRFIDRGNDSIKEPRETSARLAQCYSPRLGTAAAMLTAAAELTRELKQVSLPFLLLHGDADTVTDPAVSAALYERSCSKDKTFKLYPGMRHSLVYGSFEKNSAVVCQDIVSWLDARTK